MKENILADVQLSPGQQPIVEGGQINEDAYYELGAAWPELALFPIYNGDQMNKVSLMFWLNDFVLLWAAIEAMGQAHSKLMQKCDYLDDQMKRRTLTLPTMQPPKGADLFGKKRRAYEEWLCKQPEREEQLKKWEEQEDARIALLKEERAQLVKDRESCLDFMELCVNRYVAMCHMQVIAPDYREIPILAMLCEFLRSGRADTLQEALNLYHEEKYREESLELERQKRQEQRRAAFRQQQALLEERDRRRRELALLNAQKQAIQQDLERTRKAMEDIAFCEKLNFWLK